MIQNSKINIRLNSHSPQAESYFVNTDNMMYVYCHSLFMCVCVTVLSSCVAWNDALPVWANAKCNLHRNVKEIIQTEHINLLKGKIQNLYQIYD